MSFQDPETGAAVVGIKKVRYTHDACIDFIIADPAISQQELASIFGYSDAWISTIINSDSFQAALQERRKEVTDPILIKTVNERLRAVADLSLQRVMEKLNFPAAMIKDQFLIDAAKLSTSALGYGAKVPGSGGNVGVVINMPGVSASAASWASKYERDGAAVIEMEVPVHASGVIDHENPQIAVGRR